MECIIYELLFFFFFFFLVLKCIVSVVMSQKGNDGPYSYEMKVVGKGTIFDTFHNDKQISLATMLGSIVSILLLLVRLPNSRCHLSCS